MIKFDEMRSRNAPSGEKKGEKYTTNPLGKHSGQTEIFRLLQINKFWL